MEIFNTITTVSSEILQEFEKLSSTVVSDAIDILNLEDGGCLPYTIHPLHNYTKTLVGPITTVYAPEGTSLPVHLAMATHAKNRVLLIATDNCKSCAFLGDIQSHLAALNGCKGIVIIPQAYASTILETAKKKDASDAERLKNVKEFNYNSASNIHDFTSILTKDVAEYVKKNM